MTVRTETTTGWRRVHGSSGRWMRQELKDVDVPGTTGDLFAKQGSEGCNRLNLSFRNDGPYTVTLTILTTSQEPNSTHDATQWDQQPDISTTYTVGSPGDSDKGRRDLSLVGPFRYWKLRGASATALTTGSFDVFADYLG